MDYSLHRLYSQAENYVSLGSVCQHGYMGGLTSTYEHINMQNHSHMLTFEDGSSLILVSYMCLKMNTVIKSLQLAT